MSRHRREHVRSELDEIGSREQHRREGCRSARSAPTSTCVVGFPSELARGQSRFISLGFTNYGNNTSAEVVRGNMNEEHGMTVTKNVEQGRYELLSDEEVLSYATYTQADAMVSIPLVFTPPEFLSLIHI